MASLWQVAENVAIDLLDGLDGFADPTAHALVMQDYCRQYAMIGAVYLLQRHDVAAWRTWLALGAQAYADWLAVAPLARQTHAHAEPFWYAVLAGDATLAHTIHQRLRPDFNQGSEYEEDFAFARILHLLTCTPAAPAIAQLLDFWRGISGGGEPEFAIATALVDHDVSGLTDLLTDRLALRADAKRKEARDGSGNPDERLVLGCIDLETATLVTIARRHGLDMAIPHRLLPVEVLPTTWSQRPLVPPGAWRDEDRYHLYRDA